MEKTQQEWLEEIREILFREATKYVESEFPNCDNDTQKKLFKAYIKGFYVGVKTMTKANE